MSVLLLLKTFCSLGGAFDNQTWHLRVGHLNTILVLVRGGGGFKGANVQKLLNAWGVARGDMLKFQIDQRIKGTTSPKQMRQLLESKVEKFRQTFQV